MTDFKREALEEAERMVGRPYRMGLSAAFVAFAACFFLARIVVWMSKGHPVAGRDNYRASHVNQWLVDREAVRIKLR